jgi:hypothetical protein
MRTIIKVLTISSMLMLIIHTQNDVKTNLRNPDDVSKSDIICKLNKIVKCTIKLFKKLHKNLELFNYKRSFR